MSTEAAAAAAPEAAGEPRHPWKGSHMERRTFDSWQDFFTYMEAYQKRSNQVFTRRTATSVKTRNHVLAAMAASGRPLPGPMLPERFLDYTRMLQCPHKRVESPDAESGGACPRVRWNGVQSSDCQARVVATLQLGQRGMYQVRVTKLDLEHNHPLDPEHASVSSTSSSTDAATISNTSSTNAATTSTATTRAPATSSVDEPRAPAPAASAPVALAPKRRRLADVSTRRPEPSTASHAANPQTTPSVTTRTNAVPTMADVRQFLERAKRVSSHHRGSEQSVEERLASYVNEVAAQDGNVAKIFVDNQKVLSSITLQTKHMRKVFEAFPEVLRLASSTARDDAASGSSYGVFSLQAHDAFGNWQYVQHAIVENESAETLRAALQQFKTHNARHDRVRAILVDDGDAPELRELCASFPAARVLLSQFHVVRALHEAIARDGQGLSSWHKDRLTGIAHMLVYASSPLVYASNVAIMADVLGSKEHPFFRWFLAQWDASRERWTSFAREGVTTFCASESGDKFSPTWHAIFAAAKRDLALDETVAAIRYFQAVVERTFMLELSRAVNETYGSSSSAHSYDDTADPELRTLAATVSPAAYNLVAPQYRYATTRARFQFCEPSRDSFFISALELNAFGDDPAKEFCIEAERGWSCSCAFMVNYHLPCRHVLYVRRIVRCSCVLPLAELEPRWVLAKVQRFFDVQRGEAPARGELFEAGLDPQSPRQRPLAAQPGAWQKFAAGLEVGKRIGQRMMEMEPDEFDHAMRFYHLVEKTMATRPFALNAATIARVDAHARATARSQWASSASRTSVPTARVYGSVNDARAVAMAARTNVAPPAAVAPPVVSSVAPAASVSAASRSREVIDLQDESEVEENEAGEEDTGGHEDAEASADDKTSHENAKDEPKESEPEDEAEGANSADGDMSVQETEEDKRKDKEADWDAQHAHEDDEFTTSSAGRRVPPHSHSWSLSEENVALEGQHEEQEEEQELG